MAERPSDLLPCPFCGGDAEYIDDFERMFRSVRCAEAGCCEGPFASTAADAALAWNTRARTLDAAPSEPSAEHWRRAIADIFGPDMPATVERRACERAKEGK